MVSQLVDRSNIFNSMHGSWHVVQANCLIQLGRLASLYWHWIFCIDELDVQIYRVKTVESIEAIEITAIDDCIIILFRCIHIQCALYHNAICRPRIPILTLPVPGPQICPVRLASREATRSRSQG